MHQKKYVYPSSLDVFIKVYIEMLEVAQRTSHPPFASLRVKEWGPCFTGFSSISQLPGYAFAHKL